MTISSNIGSSTTDKIDCDQPRLRGGLRVARFFGETEPFVPRYSIINRLANSSAHSAEVTGSFEKCRTFKLIQPDTLKSTLGLHLKTLVEKLVLVGLHATMRHQLRARINVKNA